MKLYSTNKDLQIGCDRLMVSGFWSLVTSNQKPVTSNQKPTANPFNAAIKVLFFIGCLVLITNTSYSQNNYWSQQYGARSSFMGGAVVGGVQDNSAIYYNPAGIAYIDSSYLNISANAYGFDYMQIKNGAGTDLDLTSFKTLIYPQFISGLIKFKAAPKFKIAYCLLTRYRTEVKMSAENSGLYNFIPDTNSTGQYYYGTFDYELSSISQWGGLAVAYKFTPVFSMGLTTFLTYTHFDDRRSTFCSADVYKANPDSSYTTKFSNLNYNTIDHFGLLWKLGFQFSWKKVKLGFAITTPSLSLFGFTRIGRTIEYTNQNRYLPDTNLIGKNPSWLVSDDKKGLPTQMRTPLSISLGVDFDLPKTRSKLTLTIEYFYKIDEYTVANSNDPVYVRPTDMYNGQTTPGLMNLRVRSYQILNGAIGFEQKVGKTNTLYFGLRTDLNNAVDYSGNDYNGKRTITPNTLNPTYAQYLHFSSGITIKKGHSDISFGFNYGFGFPQSRLQVINLTNPIVSSTVDNASNNLYFLLQGEKEKSYPTVHSFSFIIGYTHYSKRK